MKKTKSTSKGMDASARGKTGDPTNEPRHAALPQERLESILERINDGFVAFDQRLNYIYVNLRAGEILGRAPGDLIGKNYWEEYPDAKGTSFANAYVRALETQQPVILEEYYQPFGRWFENRIYPSPEGLSIFFTEITERKQAEERLRETSERLQRIIQAANVGLWDWDLRTNKVFYSPEWKKQIGYEEAEISNDFSEWESRVHPDDLEPAVRSVNAFLAREKAEHRVEFRFRHKDGSYRWILAEASLHLDESGKPARMFGSHIDITELERAEEAHRRREEVLQMFVEHSPAAIAMFDRDMRYIVASRRFLIDYDLGEQQLIGRSHYEIFPEIPDRWKEIHRRCLAGAIEHADEDPFPRKDGKLDWIRWEIRPWREAGGEIGGVILFSEVITERKQAEEDLRASRDQLRNLAARLSETEVTERQALARELHDRVGQILTALNINLSIVQAQLEPDLAKKIGSRIEDSIKLVDETVEHVRDVMVDLHPPVLADYGLGPALRWYGELFTKRTEIPVSVEETGEVGARFTNHLEAILFRVTQEALTNIARHAQAKQVRMALDLGREAARLTIADDGCGFDPNAIISNNRKGWGLRIMRKRIQAIGGNFTLQASPGAGTIILVEIALQDNQR